MAGGPVGPDKLPRWLGGLLLPLSLGLEAFTLLLDTLLALLS